MTILYLNDKQCAMPADFSFTLKKTSLFWNEETDHTFDLDLDLSSSDNRIIFGHIDRYNVNKQIPDMTAKLIVNNRIVLAGDVYLLDINGGIITIQIVSEGTSFSYKSEDTTDQEGSRMLYDLHLGTIQDTKITSEDAFNSLQGCYPEHKYVCLPTLYKYKRRVVLNTNMSPNVWEGIANCVSPDNLQDWVPDRPFIGHPYLLFIIERIAGALGYTIRRNDLLDDEQACRELVVTAFSSLQLVNHLPSWTVAKFFREVEKHFNALCLFNRISKTIDIYTFRNEIRMQRISYIDKVLDKPDVKFEEDSVNIERNFSDVSYNFPSGYSFFKEADFSEDLLSQCTVIEVTSLDDVAAYDSKVISRYNGIDLIRRREETTSAEQGYYEYIVPVNLFRHKGDETGGLDLNIVPCIYSVGHAKFCAIPDGERINTAYKVPVIVACNEVEQEESADQGLNDMIENGVQERKRNVAEQLFIGVYNGIQKQTFKLAEYTHFFEYPEISVPLMIDTPNDNLLLGKKVLYQKEQKYSLQLTGLNSLSEHYYSSEFLMQNKYYYKIKFPVTDIIEPGEAVLRNRRMFCSSIEYLVTAQGLDVIAEGEFYEIKV